MSRRRSLSKTHAQRRHAKRRALARYGVELTRSMQQSLVADIQGGRAEFVERQSKRVSVFRVRIAGSPARVVYDRLRKTIVTVLPKEHSEDVPP